MANKNSLAPQEYDRSGMWIDKLTVQQLATGLLVGDTIVKIGDDEAKHWSLPAPREFFSRPTVASVVLQIERDDALMSVRI